MKLITVRLPAFIRTSCFKISIVVIIIAAFGGIAYAYQKISQRPSYAELREMHMNAMTTTGQTEWAMHENPVPQEKKIIAVLLYEGFTLLDAVGPMQSLGAMSDVKIVTVAKEKGPIKSDNGLTLIADADYNELKSAYILVVPGGFMSTYKIAHDEETLSWIRAIDKTTTYTTSTCTGAWVLANSGVLEGRSASTYWAGEEYLETLGVQYTGKRYTVDGKYITSAGVSAGIDMGLMLVGKIKGDAAAKTVQLLMEYAPEPPYKSGSPRTADRELVEIILQINSDHLRELENETAIDAVVE